MELHHQNKIRNKAMGVYRDMKGEKMRLFLTDTGYSKALENQEKGHIKIRNHAKVLSGDLHYDHKDRER